MFSILDTYLLTNQRSVRKSKSKKSAAIAAGLGLIISGVMAFTAVTWYAASLIDRTVVITENTVF